MSEFTFFLLNPQHRALVVLACAIGVVLCFVLRRFPWAVNVRLPSFVITGTYTCLLAFQFLRGIIGSGSNAGWFVFAGIMELDIAFPIVIAAVLLLFCRPVNNAWHPRFLIPAIMLTAIASIVLTFLFATSTPMLNFIIRDESGIPLQGIAARDVFNSPPRFTTDSTGVFRDRLSQRDIFGCCFTAEGFLEHHVTVYRSGETYYVDHSWINRRAERITVTESRRIEYPVKESTVISVIMKRSQSKN